MRRRGLPTDPMKETCYMKCGGFCVNRFATRWCLRSVYISLCVCVCVCVCVSSLLLCLSFFQSAWTAIIVNEGARAPGKALNHCKYPGKRGLKWSGGGQYSPPSMIHQWAISHLPSRKGKGRDRRHRVYIRRQKKRMKAGVGAC